jgi:hypothetical protein
LESHKAELEINPSRTNEIHDGASPSSEQAALWKEKKNKKNKKYKKKTKKIIETILFFKAIGKMGNDAALCLPLKIHIHITLGYPRFFAITEAIPESSLADAQWTGIQATTTPIRAETAAEWRRVG